MTFSITKRSSRTRSLAVGLAAGLLCSQADFAAGQGAPTTRIVGGNDVTDPADYPFFAFWEVGCGASLIHEDILLTAAHCHQPGRFWLDSVWMGSVTPFDDEGIQRRVVDRELHPDYGTFSGDHDFMVLKLNAPVTGVKPIPIAATSLDDPTSGDKITVIGFGAEFEGDSGVADQLQEVELDFIPHNTCDRQYRRGGLSVDEESEFCTGVISGRGGKDSCQGDSGGPVILDGVQIGVVSWGNGCARPGFSGVNARVSKAYDWIQWQICELSDNPPADCPERPVAPDPPSDQNDSNGGTGIGFFDWLFGFFGQ